MADLTGQRLGQYHILARISKGSTSTIYKAYQPKLDRFVAVKVLSPHVVDEEGFLERFTQEARAVAQLDHPNIVPVYDFDQIGDIAYIVFKYVESGTLRSMMKGNPLDLGLTVDIATQVGLALGYAHKHDVIHRDVKPSNILIGEGRWALLTDFGLAKILSGGKQLTHSGIGMGTADYVAPEQAQGMPGDGRADLYSLGSMLYEMLTGRLPFEADSPMAVVVKHITEAPIPPTQLVPGLAQEVEHVILTAMAKEPAARYQTAEEMVAALIRAAGPMVERVAVPSVHLAAQGALPGSAHPEIRPPAHADAPPNAAWWAKIKNATDWLPGRDRQRTLVWSLRPPWSSRRAPLALGVTAILLAAAMLLLLTTRACRPAVQATPALTRFAEGIPAQATWVATRTPVPTYTPAPGPGLTPIITATSAASPTATPKIILLSPSTPVRTGIYVKAIKPEGIILRKGAGFETDYVTTLPLNTILYVWQGPTQANSLQWFLVGDGVRSGWARQDEMVAYGAPSTP